MGSRKRASTQENDARAKKQGASARVMLMSALAKQSLGKEDEAVAAIEELATSAADNTTVQVVGGIVLQAAGKSEEALALLSQHSGSCTCTSFT